TVRVTVRPAREGRAVTADVAVDGAAGGTLVVALYENGLHTTIARGENAGLLHVDDFVVRDLVEVDAAPAPRAGPDRARGGRPHAPRHRRVRRGRADAPDPRRGASGRAVTLRSGGRPATAPVRSPGPRCRWWRTGRRGRSRCALRCRARKAACRRGA